MISIAIVTAADQGRGFALAEGLAQGLGPEDVDLSHGPQPGSGPGRRRANRPGTRARPRVSFSTSRDGAAVSAFAGAIAADASHPWFEDMGPAQASGETAVAPLRLALGRAADPSFYGELVQFGRVVPWR